IPLRPAERPEHPVDPVPGVREHPVHPPVAQPVQHEVRYLLCHRHHSFRSLSRRPPIYLVVRYINQLSWDIRTGPLASGWRRMLPMAGGFIRVTCSAARVPADVETVAGPRPTVLPARLHQVGGVSGSRTAGRLWLLLPPRPGIR